MSSRETNTDMEHLKKIINKLDTVDAYTLVI